VPQFYTNRAMAYMKLEKYDEAMRDCQKAVILDERNSKAFNKLSKCKIAFGDLIGASIALAKSMEIEPLNPTNKKDQRALDDLKITESLVKKAVGEELFEKAVTNLTQLLESCSHSISLICLKIECLMQAFQFDEADKYSNSIMKTKPDSITNNPRFLCQRGRVLIYQGNDTLGKKFFQQALNFDPDLKECQKCMKMIKRAATMKDDGAALFKESKFAEAVQHYRQCLALEPLNANYNSQILLNTAMCQIKLSQKDEAIKSLNLAIKYNPKYAKAFVKRGDLKMDLEEFNDAIRDYSEASELDSTGFNV